MSYMFAVFGDSDRLYKGFLKIHNQEFRLEIKLKDESDLSTVSVFCDWKLKNLLRNHTQHFQKKFKECKNLKEFLKYLEEVACSELEANPSSFSTQSFNLTSIIDELEKIGWKRLIKVSPSFDDIDLSCVDAKGREHVIKINLHKEHPHKAPSVSVLLPAKFDYNWEEEPSLKGLYEHFEKLIGDLQTFWGVMEDLDSNCKVIEPLQPTLIDVHRRIAIETLVSVQVTFDPLDPLAVPDVKFYGNDEGTRKLKELFYENLSLWDGLRRPSENLQAIFRPYDLGKDERAAPKSGGDGRSCAICLSFMSDEETPDVQCVSECGQYFHASCIVEWLKYQPGTRRSFKVLFGKCPNCKQSISVTL